MEGRQSAFADRRAFGHQHMRMAESSPGESPRKSLLRDPLLTLVAPDPM